MPYCSSRPLICATIASLSKKVFVLITDKDSFEPELMYKLFTKVCISMEELIKELGR